MAALVGTWGLSGTALPAGNAEIEACADDPDYALLDFWVGRWRVFSDGELVGVNNIEKILDGCALIENWTGAGGGQGKSLFFVDDGGTWQQVWVTERAKAPGGVKQKSRVEDVEPPAVRFRGELRHPERGRYLDRTTLTPMQDGEVRQLIEISTDGGKTWQPTFDAIYRPRADD